MQHSLLTLNPEDNSLLTDLYQLTMSACYIGEGIEEHRASFELFTRRLPQGFGYLIAMGLQPALEYLQNLKFTPDQIEALRATGIFNHAPDTFWTKLAQFQFTGDVWAVPEGTAIFANQPLNRSSSLASATGGNLFTQYVKLSNPDRHQSRPNAGYGR